jgi:SH3-like domain-containing protein
MIRIHAAALALALAACGRGSAPAPAGGPGAPSGGGASGAATGGGPAFVSSATALRREPTEAPKVKGPAGKDAPNALAVLQRGERVTVLEARGEDWARVRTSDDKEGWLRRAALLESEGTTEATVLAPADVFDRPDLLAANAKRKIEPGTLLLVVKTKPPFSEVSVSSGPNAWVLSDRLASGVKEVSVAKLAEKARWLKRSGKLDEARQIVALARENFAGVPLVDALAAEIDGTTPEVVPAAGAAPPR